LNHLLFTESHVLTPPPSGHASSPAPQRHSRHAQNGGIGSNRSRLWYSDRFGDRHVHCLNLRRPQRPFKILI
jgi:hypothetical protein